MIKTTAFEKQLLVLALQQGMECNGSKDVDGVLEDNMAWFGRKDAQSDLGWPKDRFSGVANSLEAKGLAEFYEEVENNQVGYSDWVLTTEGVKVAWEIMTKGDGEMTINDLVAIYNDHADKPVKKFKDKATAVQRVKDVLAPKGLVLKEDGTVVKSRNKTERRKTNLLPDDVLRVGDLSAVGKGMHKTIAEKFDGKKTVKQVTDELLTELDPPRSRVWAEDPARYIHEYIVYNRTHGALVSA